MTHVKLMGELGEKFGTDWHMATSSFRDIFKLIDCQTEGFKNYIREKAEEGILCKHPVAWPWILKLS